jgi:hypothetical protein
MLPHSARNGSFSPAVPCTTADGRPHQKRDGSCASAGPTSRDDTDNPGLIYVSPELVSNIKNCKYGLGWDTSYQNCHRGISLFVVLHMPMRHQRERAAYQDQLQQALTTTLGDIKKGESGPSPVPHNYQGMLQLLSNYIRLLTVIVGPCSAHTREVVSIRRKLRTKVDLFVDVGPQEIKYLLWAIFLDACDFFAYQVGPTVKGSWIPN